MPDLQTESLFVLGESWEVSRYHGGFLEAGGFCLLHGRQPSSDPGGLQKSYVF
jgi:hypothetical protein